VRALHFKEFGDPSKLEWVERPDPVASSKETAIVRVVAASVHPSDVKNVAHQMEGTTLPRIPGRDFSGVVEQGPSEWLGAEVWGTSGALGFSEDGSHAERVAFPVAGLVRKPRNLDHETTSAIGVNYLIAWLGLVSHAGARPGETVAVVGAGGGVGSAVVHIAKARGCRVIGVARERPPSPVADRLDEYVPSEGDFAAEIKRRTGGADVVFDTVGGVLFEASLRSLRRRGRLVVISATGKRRVEFDAIDFYHNEAQIMGVDTRALDAAASAAILSALVPGFEGEQYPPPTIGRTYSLSEGVVAYRAIAEGTTGPVVLKP
jgi:NADPH:quinone reductase-like Zn-dependent oxidoreductase